jgi:hypothetical protein
MRRFMPPAPCPIWNTPADNPVISDPDYVYYDSPRAGGRYRIGLRTLALLQQKSSSERARLTTWLCKQRSAGVEWPTVTFELVESLSSLPYLTTTERMERALLYFNRKIRVGEAISIPPSDSSVGANTFMLMALTESLTDEEVIAFLEMLEAMGWLVHLHRLSIENPRFSLTSQGWLKVEELTIRLPDSSQAFVAMWFNDETTAAYINGIAPAITASGYRPVRIDKKEHINKVDDEIIAEIRRSKFLVADFTCEKNKVRGGVYFEAGFAMALPIPVIWTCSKDSISDLHFDTRQYNHIVWETPEELCGLLKARIGAVIGDGPLLGR